MGKVIYYDFRKLARAEEQQILLHRLLERIQYKYTDLDQATIEQSEKDRKRMRELAEEELFFQRLKERGENVFDRFD